MVLGGGAFGRWLGHEGGALKNGIRALIRDPGAKAQELGFSFNLDTQVFAWANQGPSLDIWA